MAEISEKLFLLKDEKYKAFHAKLIPNINPDLIIGVRTPELRKFAKSFFNSGSYESFLDSLPHTYYEENNLHAFLIEQIKDFDKAIYETEKFLPYIDNWATSDMFLPSVFKKNTGILINHIKQYIKSDKTYTVRYGIGLLLKLYLDEPYFDKSYPDMVSKIKSNEYYINMIIAWYFATALCKQYDCAVKYLQNNALDIWTHNKTIQKACESRLISCDIKKYLKTLKRS